MSNDFEQSVSLLVNHKHLNTRKTLANRSKHFHKFKLNYILKIKKL